MSFFIYQIVSKAKCTSNLREYLLQGKKDLIRNFWQAWVLEMGVVYIGYNSKDIKTHFQILTYMNNQDATQFKLYQ